MAASKTLQERTLKYQDTLPKLPLPSLDVTCERYLRSVLPFVSQEELEHTRNAVQRFKDGVGKRLQSKLEAKARTTDNWVADWWEDAYTEFRAPLAVYSNTCGVTDFRQECMMPKEGTQIPRMAYFIHELAKCYMKLVNESWPIDKFKDGSPAEMEQYYHMLCSGRRPEPDKDVLERYLVPGSTKTTTNGIRHVTVIYRNRFYNVNALSLNFDVLTAPEIERQLYKLMRTAESKPYGPGVGALTSADRETWSKARDHLCSLSPSNEGFICEIHKSIMTLVIAETAEESLTEIMTEGLLGDCTNRWFDKGILTVFYKNGTCCDNCEHAQADGGPISSLFVEIVNNMIKTDGCWKGSAQIVHYEEPTELDFVVDSCILNCIRDAKEKYDDVAGSYAVLDIPFVEFGKKFLKRNNLRPNSFMQIAVQLAYMKLHGSCAPAYETATTRKFKHARTETTRSCTSEAVAFAQAMIDKKLPNAEKLKLLRSACDAHEKIYKEALGGEGIDRHLFGLKMICIEEGLPLPEIFTDAAWRKSGGDANFVLSTSLAGYNPSHGGCIPMVTDGYGVFYNIEPDRLQVVVSTCLKSSVTDIDRMYASLVESLLIMHRLVMTSKL